MKKYIVPWALFLVIVIGLLILMESSHQRNYITIYEMWEKGGQETNIFKILEYKDSYTEVEFNGEKYNLIGNEDDFVEVYNVGARKLAMEFLFNMEVNNLLLKKGVEYNTFGRFERRVFIQNDELPPVVDPMKWNGTKATILIWPFFHNVNDNNAESYIAENSTTREIALVDIASAYDISGNAYLMLLRNGPTWGYVHVNVEPNGAVYINVTESSE